MAMPLYFRKSKSFGPVRLTASKSGVTTSLGVKGARVGIGPRGTYVHVGRGGVSYRQTLASMPKPAPQSAPTAAPPTNDVGELIDASSEDVLQQLNQPGGSWLAKLFGRTKPTALTYGLDDAASERFATITQALGALAQAQQLWRVDSEVPTADRKHHGGATTSVTRHPARAGALPTRGIDTNISVQGIDTGNRQLYFFPERMLVRSGKRYGAVPYAGLQVRYAPIRFNEEGRVPGDTQVVGQTWRYVNKSGGPDKRFKDNRQIPVVLYGELHITSPQGLSVVLEVSSAAQAQACQQLLAPLLTMA
jgi:hypothetical protein